MNDASLTGKIKFYDQDRGYGFIAPDAGGLDVFLHATVVKQAGVSNITSGTAISFLVEHGSLTDPRGPRARSVALNEMETEL